MALECTSNKDVVVQVNKQNSSSTKYLHLTALISALHRDPDLSATDHSIIPDIMQTLYVVTGCDYISFFSEIGKTSFMCNFYQYAPFISGGEDAMPGKLSDTSLSHTNNRLGLRAFLRLVGVSYFKKYASSFEEESPVEHYNKHKNNTLSLFQQHAAWLNKIRETIWDRIAYENQMLPSTDALRLHWERSCWVIHMWRQANERQMEPLPLTAHGWCIEDDQLAIVWDTPLNMSAVKDRVALFTQGCKCKGGCTTKRCKLFDRVSMH